MLHAPTIPRYAGSVQRLALVLALAGCRLHFDDRPADAQDAPADAPPLALACNTPVKVADAPLGGKLTAAATTSTIIAEWIEPDGQLATGRAELVAPLAVVGRADVDPGATGYTVVSATAAGDTIVSASTHGGTSYIELFDAHLTRIAGPAASAVGVLGPRGIVATNQPTGPIAAVTGNDAITVRAEILPVNRDGTLGTPVDSGNVNTLSTIANAGDRLDIVDIPPTNACEIKTADLAVTSRTSTVGWGTVGQCTEGTVAVSPGRSDALLVRHDLTDADLNHVIATRAGLSYTIPGEMRLRNPGDEPRPAGVADGYWVSYETGGMLEAAHVDFAGAVGTPVVLGPLVDATAHDTVVLAGEPYVIWVQDGLELAHLCP